MYHEATATCVNVGPSQLRRHPACCVHVKHPAHVDMTFQLFRESLNQPSLIQLSFLPPAPAREDGAPICEV